MSASHTKGPWYVDTHLGKQAVVDDESNVVAEHISNVTNARLISAAPEMLSMLYKVLNLLSDPDADCFDADRMEREILEVIKKATRGAE